MTLNSLNRCVGIFQLKANADLSDQLSKRPPVCSRNWNPIKHTATVPKLLSVGQVHLIEGQNSRNVVKGQVTKNPIDRGHLAVELRARGVHEMDQQIPTVPPPQAWL